MRIVVDVPGFRLWQHTLGAPWTLPAMPGVWSVLLVDAGNLGADANAWAKVQTQVADALVDTGCRAVTCAGHNAVAWEDAIDWANVMAEVKSGVQRPTVMTTSHPHASVDDVVQAFRCSLAPGLQPLMLLVGRDDLLERRFVRALAAQ